MTLELALIFILLVIASTIISVFLLGRTKDYLRRLRALEKQVKELREEADEKPENVPAAPAPNLAAMAESATPEQVEQANAILRAMGMRVD